MAAVPVLTSPFMALRAVTTLLNGVRSVAVPMAVPTFVAVIAVVVGLPMAVAALVAVIAMVVALAMVVAAFMVAIAVVLAMSVVIAAVVAVAAVMVAMPMVATVVATVATAVTAITAVTLSGVATAVAAVRIDVVAGSIVGGVLVVGSGRRCNLAELLQIGQAFAVLDRDLKLFITQGGTGRDRARRGVPQVLGRCLARLGQSDGREGHQRGTHQGGATPAVASQFSLIGIFHHSYSS